MEKLADTCAHSHSSPAQVESEPVVIVQEAMPKFRELKGGENVVDYLLGFESHYFNYAMNSSQWAMKLAHLLPPEPMSIYSAMEAEDRELYDKVKEALYT